MRLFDVLGPVMTGPSSSHTAGAVRIGLTARNLLGEAPKTAEILLHGSFAATGRGHGTDRALVAGLLGSRTMNASRTVLPWRARPGWIIPLAPWCCAAPTPTPPCCGWRG